jgi:hypothetical protein
LAPGWLTIVAWTYLSVCFVCVAVMAFDIFANRRRQAMGVMNFVFPITGLYFGPFVLTMYWRWARGPVRAAVLGERAAAAHSHGTEVAQATTIPVTAGAAIDHVAHGGHLAMGGGHEHAYAAEVGGTGDPAGPLRRDKPHWVTMAIEVSHCGSGCTLGDVISEFVIFALGLKIAGLALPVEYIGDYLLAVAFGVAFQYFAIAPMLGLGFRDGLRAAAKADVVSLTFFEIGLFGWMALMAFVFFPAPRHLHPSSGAYWFLMQIGMMIGFFTSWPANVWLVDRGIKATM